MSFSENARAAGGIYRGKGGVWLYSRDFVISSDFVIPSDFVISRPCDWQRRQAAGARDFVIFQKMLDFPTKKF